MSSSVSALRLDRRPSRRLTFLLAVLHVFALLVPEMTSGYYPSLLASFEEAAMGTHNQVIAVSTRDDAYRQADSLLQLIDKRVSGIALVPATNPPTPPYQIRQVQAQRIPVVLCHRPVTGVRAPLLAFNGRDVGRRAAGAMLKRGHRRVAYLSDGAPDAVVTIDREQISQALWALLQNGAEAAMSGPGAPQVCLSATLDERLSFHVADNGPCVSADARSRIFRPFYTTKTEGSGIGLSLARQIARAHGGDLVLHPGRATEFEMTLPGAQG